MLEPSHKDRRETILVAVLTLVGAVLRFWQMGRLGLNHFDEGIYAIAATWSLSPKGLSSISPELVSYAPPLYPILVGVMYLFLGVTDISAILVSQIAGILTIPAVAWVARRTFGPGAAVAAAALVAISGPHICFSRMALTDSTFLLCWVLALGVGGWFLERPGIVRASLLGLMVGLAQNTKYNGYLAGGIVALTAIWGLIIPSEKGRAGGVKAVAYGLIAALIALVVYWPWYRFVESQSGGYAGLLKHHRSYLTGTSPYGWFLHWRLQMAESYALSGELGVKGLNWSAAAWAMAWIGGTYVAGRGEEKGYQAGMRRRLGFIVGFAVLGVAPNAGYWIALASVPFWLMDASPSKRLLALGWTVMAILTPFYHPYSRLWLPLHAFGWITLAGLIPDPNRFDGASVCLESKTKFRLRVGSLSLAIVASVFSDAVAEPRFRHLGSPIEPCDSMRLACDRVMIHLESQVPTRLQIVARPAVLFYLSRNLKIPMQRQDNIDGVFKTWRPGDFVLMDSTLDRLSSEGAYPFASERFDNTAMSRRLRYFKMPTPAVTHLDIDPAGAFDPHIDIKPGSALDIYPIIPK